MMASVSELDPQITPDLYTLRMDQDGLDHLCYHEQAFMELLHRRNRRPSLNELARWWMTRHG